MVGYSFLSVFLKIYNKVKLYEKTKSTVAYELIDLDDYQTMGKKILCGKFAESLKNNFAVGDENNNLILYNLITPKPIAVLNPMANNSVSALTALTFTQSD